MALISLIFLMLLFQNCGQSENNNFDDISSIEQSEADALPFAFDLTVDHIAYMSCDSNSVNQSGKLFNFKAGAFNNNEGIKIRESFRSSLAGKSKRFVLKRLAASKRNKGAGVVMSVREGGRFQGPILIGGDDGGTGLDAIGNYMAPMIWNPISLVHLTSEKVLNFLWDRPDGVNYLEGFSNLEGKTFEGEIAYNTLGAQQLLRNAVSSDSYLTFTFATENLENLGVQARAPSSEEGNAVAANGSVWGKGYKMNFAQINPTRPNSPRRALSSVRGYNLENESSLDEDWVCPPSERYIVVRNTTDALRRYDAANLTRGSGGSAVANNPWDSAYDPGPETQGGYMMNVMIPDTEDIDSDGDSNELVSVRRKVVCPTIPDDIDLGSSEHTIDAWKRIRSLLPGEDWYVFRGPRYNCVVPKQNDTACYGNFENSQGSSGTTIIQYLPDEDLPEFWIKRKKDDVARGETNTVVVRETECEGPSTPGRFCPQVISVCHKR